MPKYIKLTGNLTRSPRQMHGLLNSAAAKGRRTIDGHSYHLLNTDTKAIISKLAKTYRQEGRSARIFKSKHYGDWELWVSLKRRIAE